MRVFLETERLVLRRFTAEDVDLLVELDSDPEVMRFITGGLPTPRREVEAEILPAYLDYYERDERFGFWAAIERSSGTSSVGSISDLGARTSPIRSSSDTGCAARPGGRDMPPRVRAL